jgi:hypothetical protein
MRIVRVLFLSILCASPHIVLGERCEHAPYALKQAAYVSGLSRLRAVSCEELTAERFLAKTRNLVLKDVSLDRLVHEESVLKALGIVPREYPYAACLVDDLARNAAAFYAPALQGFAVPSWHETPMAVLVHEATHALQDHHFNVRTFGTRTFVLSDENFAASALLEGHAMYIESQYLKSEPQRAHAELDESMRLAPHDAQCGMPIRFAQLLDAPYELGERFVAALVRVSGESAVLAAFKRPPRTSREIMHPERYLAGESTVTVAPGPSQRVFRDGVYTRILSESIGEFGLLSLLASRLPINRALPGSIGWRGDLLEIYLRHRHVIAEWQIVLATEEAALKLFQEYTEVLRRSLATAIDARTKSYTIDVPEGELSLRLSNSRVYVHYAGSEHR